MKARGPHSSVSSVNAETLAAVRLPLPWRRSPEQDGPVCRTSWRVRQMLRCASVYVVAVHHAEQRSPFHCGWVHPVSTISDIPPTDIESIDMLKDTSSTAIYGCSAQWCGDCHHQVRTGRQATAQLQHLLWCEEDCKNAGCLLLLPTTMLPGSMGSSQR